LRPSELRGLGSSAPTQEARLVGGGGGGALLAATEQKNVGARARSLFAERPSAHTPSQRHLSSE
jgi:hypothetical protein